MTIFNAVSQCTYVEMAEQESQLSALTAFECLQDLKKQSG